MVQIGRIVAILDTIEVEVSFKKEVNDTSVLNGINISIPTWTVLVTAGIVVPEAGTVDSLNKGIHIGIEVGFVPLKVRNYLASSKWRK